MFVTFRSEGTSPATRTGAVVSTLSVFDALHAFHADVADRERLDRQRGQGGGERRRDHEA